MTTYLFDANVLIALTTAEHVHHGRVSKWASAVERFALCPIVEGSLIRFAVRLGATSAEAAALLAAVRARRGFEFWPDDLSYVDVALNHVYGHRQVTDAYLMSMVAERPGTRLATLDEALFDIAPDLVVLVR